MTTPILYSKSKFHYLMVPYPEKPNPPFSERSIHPVAWTDYDEAVAASLASAVEFDRQDQEKVAELVFYEMGKRSGPRPLMLKDIKDGELFAVEGISVEVVNYQEPTVSQFDLQAGRVPMGSQISVTRQVVRLKAKPESVNVCPNSMYEGTACSEGKDCTCAKSELRPWKDSAPLAKGEWRVQVSKIYDALIAFVDESNRETISRKQFFTLAEAIAVQLNSGEGEQELRAEIERLDKEIDMLRDALELEPLVRTFPRKPLKP